jgi:hypothetical protein
MRWTIEGSNRTLAGGLLTAVKGGRLEIYAGARLDTVESPLEFQQLLAVAPLRAFDGPSVGAVTAILNEGVPVQATGAASMALLVAADGSRIADYSVGKIGRDHADVLMTQTDLRAGDTMTVTSLTIALSAS